MYTFPEDRDHITLGLISDTHGLLRDEAVEALQDSDLIIHAGDIGALSVIDQLGAIADVVAVRGNMDRDEVAGKFPLTETVQVNEVLLYAIHDLGRLDLDPGVSGIDVVIFGHSHEPFIQKQDGILYVNPGSAGPRRFKLPVSLGKLHISGKTLNAELITLTV
ncbi:MAG: metallophosphoesterase family protein [Nitrospiraceae bacterium]|nr:MAG: metallophosphoesterase family protein [Nitrospiraceae bacterium]